MYKKLSKIAGCFLLEPIGKCWVEWSLDCDRWHYITRPYDITVVT